MRINMTPKRMYALCVCFLVAFVLVLLAARIFTEYINSPAYIRVRVEARIVKHLEEFHDRAEKYEAEGNTIMAALYYDAIASAKRSFGQQKTLECPTPEESRALELFRRENRNDIYLPVLKTKYPKWREQHKGGSQIEECQERENER